VQYAKTVHDSQPPTLLPRYDICYIRFLLIKYRYRIDIAIFWQYPIDTVSNSKNQYRCITSLTLLAGYREGHLSCKNCFSHNFRNFPRGQGLVLPVTSCVYWTVESNKYSYQQKCSSWLQYICIDNSNNCFFCVKLLFILIACICVLYSICLHNIFAHY